MREIRQRQTQLPIVILTTHGSLPSAIEAVRFAATDYLLKPVSLETLRNRVAAILDQQRAKQSRNERIKTMYTQLQALMCDEGIILPDSYQDEIASSHLSARSSDLSGSVYHVGPIFMDVHQHLVRMDGRPVDLTPTEFTVLLELIRQPGVVVPCTKLVSATQNISLDEEESRQMMRPHIVRLRRKIEPDPQNPTYIQSVRGIGYRWSQEEM